MPKKKKRRTTKKTKNMSSALIWLVLGGLIGYQIGSYYSNGRANEQILALIGAIIGYVIGERLK